MLWWVKREDFTQEYYLINICPVFQSMSNNGKLILAYSDDIILELNNIYIRTYERGLEIQYERVKCQYEETQSNHSQEIGLCLKPETDHAISHFQSDLS